MKKKIISFLFAIFLIFALKNTCSAASASISCPSSVKVGETATINVTGSAVQWKLSLKVNGTEIASSNDVENIDGNKTISFSGKYTPQSTGTLNVTLEGNATEFSDGTTIRNFASKTIEVVNADSGNNNNSGGDSNQNNGGSTTGGNTTTKSSEARLSNLGIRPNDFKGFKRNTYSYDISVPNDVSEVEVYASSVNNKAKISGTGKIKLKEGKNTAKVTVTAEDGKTKKTYTLNITRETANETPNTTTTDSDATLKNLGITPKEYDFSGFKKDTMQYSAEVPNDVTNVEIYAETTSSSAKITGTGKVDLKEGENSFNVEVTAKDGTKKTYTIAIKRAVAQTTVDNNPDEEKNLRLSKLIISNFDLVPNFDKEIYEYKIDVDENISKLDLTAEANEKNAKIEILGNENLKEGENVITIILTNEETQEVTTYQIIVNKSTPQEIIGIAKWTNPSTWGLKEKVIVATGVALVLIIIVAIVLKIRLAKQDIDYDVELPGGEELDKALSKHQELVEDTEENQKHEIVEENTSFDDNPETPTYIKSTFKDDIFPEKKVDANKEIYIDDSIPNDYTEQYTSNRKKGKHSL